uniref:Uncharacterized protein n=1 Tax=Glossina brevipalpis TaxID=37001 RepID=A0A1A9WYA1_9MUSC
MRMIWKIRDDYILPYSFKLCYTIHFTFKFRKALVQQLALTLHIAYRSSLEQKSGSFLSSTQPEALHGPALISLVGCYGILAAMMAMLIEANLKGYLSKAKHKAIK